MSEVVVHFAIDRTDAEVAASALRVERLHPRVAPDDASPRFGAGTLATFGRWLVYVPDREAEAAREILEEPRLEEAEDNPVFRLLLITALIAGLLLATPFVAQVCYRPF